MNYIAYLAGLLTLPALYLLVSAACDVTRAVRNAARNRGFTVEFGTDGLACLDLPFASRTLTRHGVLHHGTFENRNVARTRFFGFSTANHAVSFCRRSLVA